MEEDTEAALEWMEFEKSKCPGCGQPKHESFAPETSDKRDMYNVDVLECHACAARDRRAYTRNADRDKDAPPEFGKFYVVTGPTDD